MTDHTVAISSSPRPSTSCSDIWLTAVRAMADHSGGSPGAWPMSGTSRPRAGAQALRGRHGEVSPRCFSAWRAAALLRRSRQALLLLRRAASASPHDTPWGRSGVRFLERPANADFAVVQRGATLS